MFFDKTCTISQVTYNKVGWTSKRVKTAIYTDVECNFEVKKMQQNNEELGKNPYELKYIVVVPLQYNLIRENYIVELTDPDLWYRGSYIIDDVQADRSIWGEIDCITFIAKETRWQL